MLLVILLLLVILCLMPPVREYFSSSWFCKPLRKACKIITESPASCIAVDSEWEGTCVAMVGGPEDLPGVAACSAAAFSINEACTNAVKEGGKFDYDECKKAIGC